MTTPPPTEKSLPPAMAVAIAYLAEQTIPKVVAKGRGALAEAIIARGKEAGVYVHESRELVSLLMQVDLDAEIPPALYRAVAELLAWIYHLEHGSQVAPLLHTPDDKK